MEKKIIDFAMRCIASRGRKSKAVGKEITSCTPLFLSCQTFLSFRWQTTPIMAAEGHRSRRRRRRTPRTDAAATSGNFCPFFKFFTCNLYYAYMRLRGFWKKKYSQTPLQWFFIQWNYIDLKDVWRWEQMGDRWTCRWIKGWTDRWVNELTYKNNLV